MKTSQNSQQASSKQSLTVGLDLGDRQHVFCALDHRGAVLESGRVGNTPEALGPWLSRWPDATVVMEAGTHSPWISRLIEGADHPVIIANARKTRAIWQSDRKDDFRDAQMLARLGRVDPLLLSPVSHRNEAVQRDHILLKSRECLVKTRVQTINTIRGLLKSQGILLPSGWSTESFARKARDFLDHCVLPLVEALLEVVKVCNEEIKLLEQRIEALIAHTYPAAARLRSVPGVGPITALSFVLTLEDPHRFRKARSLGAYLGLTPKRDQSGQCDKQLRITKEGPATLRRLLVSCAQYILGPFGPPSALREVGQRLAQRGGKNQRKRAVIAVARKLAMVLLKLWQRPERSYQPFPLQAAA